MGKRDAATVDDVSGEVLDASHPEPATTRDRADQLRVLMTEHGRAVYSMCIKTLRDRELAEDVLQQVFLAAFRGLDQFQGRAKVRTWLLGIAMHRCQDAIKMRRRREKRFHTDEHAMINAPDPNADIAAPLESERVRAALEDCLNGLSAESRAAVLARFHDGMSYEEMSRAVGETPSALRARVTRALPLVRRCLERKGWTGE